MARLSSRTSTLKPSILENRLAMKNTIPLLLFLSIAICGTSLAQTDSLTNIKQINTEELDFSPVPYGDGVIYTSSKSDRFLKCPAENPGHYTDLYYAERKSDGTFGKRVSLKGKVNGKYNDGTATFNVLGNKMIFTRNSLNGRNAQDSILLKLYSAGLEGDQWTNVTELPFNSDDWSTCHPTLSNDGTLLIFASNRDGAMNGSMDLYASRFENGDWSEPVNLGPDVNTNGNEIFPFIDEKGNLFYATNGRGGNGQLDIFAAQADDNGKWKTVGNIGTPFNSSDDEVAFVPLNNGTEGYLATANREGGKGLDDIYYWKRSLDPLPAVIVVIDEATGERLPGATVNINPTKLGSTLDKIYGEGEVFANRPLNLTTGKGGSVSIEAVRNSEYSIDVSLEDYEPANRTPSTADLTAQPEYIIPIKRKHYTAKLTGLVYDKDSGDPIPLSDIKLVDKTTGKTITIKTDGSGEFTSEIDCDHLYEITATAAGYDGNTITLNNFALDCKKNGEVHVKIPLQRALVVYLEPIFFDFDKYNIRKPDAQLTLDSLVILLNEYPSLQVNLSGHCDARGSFGYNDILGAKRAKSAESYLLKKGISADRLTTSDYGERKPVNHCVDHVYCPEPAHQLNRRVDVQPVSHNEVGVDFKTRPIDTGVKSN
jgi:outer membrane protein OmpA-like peptidoglycan-associated protein/Tol biopolymer transport system component